METYPEAPAPEWDLQEWKQALTIRVGSAYGCRTCGNLVMVTKGGVGVLDLRCCGAVMEQLAARKGGGQGAAS